MKALKNLYSKEDNLGPMQHFTTRFKSRFLEIAIGEPELISRCLAIEILTIVDSHGGILENQQRNQLMKLIFDQEIRVRRSISKFFKNFLNEVYDSKRMKIGSSVKNEKRSKGKESKTNGGSIEGDQIEKGLKLKCLASLLIKFGKDGNRSVENRQEREDDLSSNHQTEPEEEEEEEEATDEEGRNEGTMGIGSLSEFPEKSRIALAIESLWDEIEVIRDWQSMSDYLLLDHSTVITEAAKNGRTSKSRKNRRGSMIRTGEGEDEDEDEEDDDEYGSVEEGCKLTEHEENVLLEIFLVTLSQSTESLTEEELLIQKERLKKKKRRLKQKEKQKEGLMTEEEEERSEEEEEEREEELNGIGMVENSNKIEISKVMMKVFPKLYTKYSHDPIRLSEVLRIPKLLSLGLYLDLRMVSAYENLWDILINEYIKQQVQRTISVISSTINHLLSFARSLSHINIKKIEHLDKVLLKNLKRLAFKEEEEEDRMIDLETCGFELQEIDRFYFSLLKITYLFRSRDLSSILLGISDDDLDDDHMMLDGSVKKTVVIEIILGLANRGRLNYPEEIKMVEVAIEILQLNFMWTCASSSKMMNEVLEIEEESEKKKKEEEQKELVERVLKFRDRFLDLMKEYAIDPECNACDNIKRAAFIHLLNIYMISYGSLMPDQLKIDCDQQTQFRCAGFIAAEIERFGNQMKEKAKEKGKWRIDDEEETEEEEEEVDRRGKKGKGKEKEKKVSRADRQRMYRSSSFKELRIQEEFEMLMTTFTKAICCGVIDIQHSNVILAHFNRFGDVFDLGVEVLIGSLKGFCFGNGEISGPKKEALAKTVSESFRESFELFLNEEIGSEEQFIKVSKLLASSIVIRGARLSVKSILDQQSYVILHNGLIDWALKQIIKFEKDFDRLDRFGVFFKGLYSLMIGMDGRAALKIKSSIDLSLEKNEIEIPRNSKAWDPYRTYIKRLISIMAKDPTIKRAAKLTLKRKADQNEAEADEDDHERIRVDDEATEDEVEGEGERSQAPSSRLQDRSEEGLNDLPEKRIKKTSRHSTIGKGKARAVSDEIPSDEEDEEESTRVETQSNQQTEKTLKKASKSIKNKKGRTNEILENQSSTDHGMRTEMNLKRRHQSSQLECVMIPNQSSPSSPSIQPSTPNPLRKRSSLLSVMIPISHPKRKRFDHDENEEGSDERNRVEEVKSVGSESKKRRIENGNRNGNGNGNGNEKSEEGSEERVGVEVEEEDEEDEEIGSEISLAEVKRRARKGKK
ncbi:hypothetical protein DFH28DRAFT_329820 [Melampsora americana]|nr:hypothetical protein DFH28DRAFT_329820 [Melampsora americana]